MSAEFPVLMLCRLGREPERAFEVTMLSRAFLSPSSADGIQRESLFCAHSSDSSIAAFDPFRDEICKFLVPILVREMPAPFKDMRFASLQPLLQTLGILSQ